MKLDKVNFFAYGITRYHFYHIFTVLSSLRKHSNLSKVNIYLIKHPNGKFLLNRSLVREFEMHFHIKVKYLYNMDKFWVDYYASNLIMAPQFHPFRSFVSKPKKSLFIRYEDGLGSYFGLLRWIISSVSETGIIFGLKMFIKGSFSNIFDFLYPRNFYFLKLIDLSKQNTNILGFNNYKKSFFHLITQLNRNTKINFRDKVFIFYSQPSNTKFIVNLIPVLLNLQKLVVNLGFSFYIKPHPRDLYQYTEFNSLNIIDRNFNSESLLTNNKVSVVAGFDSTMLILHSISNTKVTSISLSSLKEFKPTNFINKLFHSSFKAKFKSFVSFPNFLTDIESLIK